MTTISLLCVFATLGLHAAPANTAADVLTLRDGKVVLGQVVDSDRRGPLLIVVRRSWATTNLPEKAAAWEKAEGPTTQRAEAQRRERLAAWKRERRPNAADGDRITPWIDRELVRLNNPNAPPPKSYLVAVKVNRTDVKALTRKPRTANRMLRLGWLSNLPDVETMPQEDLAQALEGRGFSPRADTPVSIDPLLPPQLEDEARWLVRRAATEVLNDPGGRLLRYQGMVMAEPAAGEAPPAAASLNAAIGTIKELLGEAPVDPLPGKLRELAGQGRVGAVVTRLDLSPDLSSVQVETTLWVRSGDRWNPAIVRSSTVRPDDLPANAADGLADDPQVKAVFGIVEGLGLGEVPPELKRRSLNMGAATRKALGQARGALDQELNSAALSLEPKPAPKP